ncbi:MAG TPA: hypothetical protein VL989_01660 [Candidatus Sulfotelmatobacter sp.]|nr:hypothetical protein [Candidatus Sulfotelmatobacter sp.]
MFRYLIWLITVFALLVILIILLIPGGKKTQAPKTLESYSSTNAVAVMTIDGPVNADVIHQSIEIDVMQNQVVYKQIDGYNGKIAQQITYPNTEASYYAFLRSLDIAGYEKGNTNPNAANPVGYCSLGDRYIFNLNQNGSNLIHFWATSCGSPKTYAGDLSLTLSLFKAQIPDYDTVAANTNI